MSPTATGKIRRNDIDNLDDNYSMQDDIDNLDNYSA